MVAVVPYGRNQLAGVFIEDLLDGSFPIFGRWATAAGPRSRYHLGSEADPVSPECPAPAYWDLIHSRLAD